MLKTLFILICCVGCTHLKRFPIQGSGGYSGLAFEGKNSAGELIFLANTDRGPNAESFLDPQQKHVARPFVDPKFQPRLVQLILDPVSKKVREENKIFLSLPSGRALTGLPNFPAAQSRTGDEFPVTLEHKPLPFDREGIDPEGLCQLNDSIWMVEEYGPSILKFDLKGRLEKRFVPVGYFRKGKVPSYVRQVLPPELMRRQLNRGFEGIACGKDVIFAAMQSPLPQDDNRAMILKFDAVKEQVLKVFYYKLEDKKYKIGDIALVDDQLLVIEQNSEKGPQSFHKIFEVEILDHMLSEKKLKFDLVKLGYDFADKIEGLAVIDSETIAIINDNDFGINRTLESVLGLVKTGSFD